MKSLSLAKPLIILVIGIPGSGKSFFARQFSDTFKAPLVSYDRLRHIIFGNEDLQKAEETKLEQLVNIEIHEILKTHKTLVVDGTGFSKVQRAAIRKQASSKGYDVFPVWVQTDEATAKYRSMKRSGKKKDDAYSSPISNAEYERLKKRFSMPAINEKHVVISGKHTYPAQARVVLKRLVEPRSKRAIVNHPNRKPNAQEPRRNVIIR